MAMSGRGVRFDPPALPLTPAVRWMLLRAFGPPGAALGAVGAVGAAGAAGAAGGAAPPAVAPAAALALSRRFDLAARIAARQGRARLAAELGETAVVEGFVHDRAAAAAATLRAMALVEQVAAAAAARQIPVVFLKLAALELLGVLAPGSRAGCDLDVLAPAERAGELLQALVERGFRASPLPEQEHQLAALEGPDGVVEVHRMLLGVRLDGRPDQPDQRPGQTRQPRRRARSARWADLQRAGLLTALPRLPGAAAVPVPAVAAAHALVHGIAQHGWAPGSYSLLRMVGDLIDLGFAESRPLAASVAAWVAGDVTPVEVEAARRLAAELAAGAWEDSRAPEAVLLRHALAGRLDPEYQRSLRLALFRRQPSDLPQALRLARAVAGTVWLSRARVDAIYGPPRHRLGYLGRRLLRPLDLLARLASSARQAWRVRRRPAGNAGGGGTAP